MATSPIVSIILPTFNRLRYLPEAVASIFGQTFQDWELLIADDGSDAKTMAYLQTLVDPPRVKLIQLHHTGRPAAVRNAALRDARGEYIAFMDSDDVWMPSKLAIQIARLRARGDRGWSHTNFTLVNACGNSAREMQAIDGWILGPLLRTETVIALPSVIASRVLLDQVGHFDEQLVMCEDYDLWLRMASRSQIDAINEPLTIVRRHGEHYGNQAMSFRDSLRVVDKVIRSGSAAQYEYFLHKRRALASGSLAKCYAASGDRSAALRTLASTAPASWRHQGWWSEALSAIALAIAPQGILNMVRRYRRRS
jgi:glycosyltransferase involved in cell wall biosynthesis